jgi:hypothetical protein
MIGRGLNGSAVQYVTMLSPVALATPGSTTAYDLREATHGTVVVTANSADLAVHVQRSGTSDGTFQGFGASLQSVASKTAVRSFAMNSSAIFYRVAYTNANLGSIISTIHLLTQGNRTVPVTQLTGTVVSSDVA